MKTIKSILLITALVWLSACSQGSSGSANVVSTLECLSTDSNGMGYHYKLTTFDSGAVVVYGKVYDRTNVQSYLPGWLNYENKTIGVPLSNTDSYIIELDPNNRSTIRAFHNNQAVTLNSNCK